MRVDNFAIDFNGTDIAGNLTSDPFSVEHISNWAYQVVIAGGTAPTGTFQVQVSCDESVATHWSDLSSASIAVTDNGTFFAQFADAGYKWVRIKWTATSGTGSITSARAQIKGV